MSVGELEAKMLEWGEAQRRADALRAEIEAAVLEIGETQRVGGVHADYSAGRKAYDYRRAIEIAEQNGAFAWKALERYTAFVPAKTTVDYRAACRDFGIEDIPCEEIEPSVSLYLW